MKIRLFIFVLSAISLSAGCGKRVDLTGVHEDRDRAGCQPNERVHWSFVQPAAQAQGDLDLLLVVDTSASMNNKRKQLASDLPALLDAIRPGVGFHVAVLLGNGGTSSLTGHLYSAPGVPLVLKSSDNTIRQIKESLTRTLDQVPRTEDDANGEALFYSLNRALEPSRIKSSQEQGFFRENAQLAVFFISDENDICYEPQKHGFSQFPDFVPSVGGIEVWAFRRYCAADSITPQSLFEKLSTLKQGKNLSVNAIVHKDPASVPLQGEESIGHGFIELVQQDKNGQVVEISESNYSNAFKSIGSLITRLDLLTQFQLSGGLKLKRDSVITTVDGTQVPSQYDSLQQLLNIRPEDAGQALSVVDVSACPK